MLKVINPGARTLLQDLGRYHMADLGISQGGPLDIYAFYSANYLLENKMNSSVLEISLGNVSFEFEKDTTFSITGADMPASLNEKPIENWRTHTAKQGDFLKLGYTRSGNVAYLSVKNGFSVNKTIGSTSTVTRNNLGGITGNGKSISRQDAINYESTSNTKTRKLSNRHIPDYNNIKEINLILSYQSNFFNKEDLNNFFSAKYKLLPNSDRMGYRFSGPSIKSKESGIISEGIALGSIQIPPDGQPIILMQDRQTIGGYPKLGCIKKTDLSKLSQLRFGEKISFIEDSIENATKEWLSFCSFFKLYK